MPRYIAGKLTYAVLSCTVNGVKKRYVIAGQAIKILKTVMEYDGITYRQVMKISKTKYSRVVYCIHYLRRAGIVDTFRTKGYMEVDIKVVAKSLKIEPIDHIGA